MRRTLPGLLLTCLLAACAPKSGHPPAAAASPLDQDALNTDIDREIGGLGTCVILADVESGRTLYQYGHFDVCDAARLPPCATFHVPAALTALDTGAVTPTTVFKWDGAPQPIKAWQVDADVSKAVKGSIDWWFARAAKQIGAAPFAAELQKLDYGDAKVTGPITAFWQGPVQRGGLTISTRQQVDFMRRLYAGQLPVKPGVAALVENLMVDDVETDAKGRSVEIDGVAGSCSTEADGSRGVGWWVGRLKTADHNIVFAASVVAPEPPPGADIAEAIKDAFTDTGAWPRS